MDLCQVSARGLSVVNPVQPTLGSSFRVPIAFQIFGTSPGDSHFDGKLHITSHLDGAAVGHRIPCCSPCWSSTRHFLWASCPSTASGLWAEMLSFISRHLNPLGGALLTSLNEIFGASFLGGIPRRSVDFNELACCHLNANSWVVMMSGFVLFGRDTTSFTWCNPSPPYLSVWLQWETT